MIYFLEKYASITHILIRIINEVLNDNFSYDFDVMRYKDNYVLGNEIDLERGIHNIKDLMINNLNRNNLNRNNYIQDYNNEFY